MPKTPDRETVIVIGVGALALLLVVAFLVFSPSGGDFGRRDVAGPAEFQSSVAADHADQFDDELPERAAGSQQEQAAATYILGVMQRNGYLVRLESVPVRNLVNSTNLIAIPPEVDEPRTLVAVPYGEGAPGAALGTFLELSRALSVAAPEHEVAFVALGAEFVAGDRLLGSRRMARFMLDEGWDPQVILVDGEGNAVFDEAGFEVSTRTGPPEVVGPDLLRLLAEPGQ